MSAIAATSIDQIGILTALPQAAPATPQIAPAFNGLLSALFGSPAALPNDATQTAATSQSNAAPSQEIAGALIRSMFRGATFQSPQPVSATMEHLPAVAPDSATQTAVAQTQATPSKEIAIALIQSMFRGATVQPPSVSGTIETPNASVPNGPAQAAGPSKDIAVAPVHMPQPIPATIQASIPDGSPQIATPQPQAAPAKDVASALVRSLFRGATYVAPQATKSIVPPTSSPTLAKIATNISPVPIAPAGNPPSILPVPAAVPVIPPAPLATVVTGYGNHAEPQSTREQDAGQIPAITPPAVQSVAALIDATLQIARFTPPPPSNGSAPARPIAKFTTVKQVSTGQDPTAPSIAVLPTPIPNLAPAPQPLTVDPSPAAPLMARHEVTLPAGDSQSTPAATDSSFAPRPTATRPDTLPQAQLAQPQPEHVAASDLAFAAVLTPISAPPNAAKSAAPPTLPSDPPVARTPAEEQAASKPVDNTPPRAPASDPGTGSAPRREDAKAPVVIPAPAVPQMPQDFAPAFARATETFPMPRGTDSKVDAPPAVAADALRASETQPVSPAPSFAVNGSAQEISFRLSQPAAPPVDLHVTERGGEIRVSVRTPDATLETSLRQNLPALANSLEHAGYHAETFVPQISSQRPGTREDGDSSHPDWSGRGNSGGSQNGGRQQPREQRQKSWIEALENAQ